LIDEPEISLHITWQKEFLDDLLKIIKMQNFQVLIATHSPSIINGRWDLVYNLEKKDDNIVIKNPDLLNQLNKVLRAKP